MRLTPVQSRAGAATLLLTAGVACTRPPSGEPAPPAPSWEGHATAVRMMRDVAFLASEALEGRAAGTPGDDSAAAYVARTFESLGLEPAIGRRDCGWRERRHPECRWPYYQQFALAATLPGAHAMRRRQRRSADIVTQNVVALLPGSDSTLRGQVLVVGAHLDHLGRSPIGALDPDSGAAIRNGADDNASGTAAVLELARRLSADPPRRSVLFVTFGAEELGLLGSRYFVDHAPVPLDSIQAMLNFDMVGRMRNDRLIIYGVASAAGLDSLVAATAAADPTLRLTLVSDPLGASDHASFFLRGIPALHLFTDLHPDYHRSTDDPAAINPAGLVRVVEYSERLIRELADRPERLAFVRAADHASARSDTTTSSRSETYLGSIPDMGSAVRGVRLAGVRPDSPAERAGLREGDIVVELGGRPVTNLYDYTDALYARQPGDTIAIVIERGTDRVTLTATLGRRGG